MYVSLFSCSTVQMHIKVTWEIFILIILGRLTAYIKEDFEERRRRQSNNTKEHNVLSAECSPSTQFFFLQLIKYKV